jgi:hypothetical protein
MRCTLRTLVARGRRAATGRRGLADLIRCDPRGNPGPGPGWGGSMMTPAMTDCDVPLSAAGVTVTGTPKTSGETGVVSPHQPEMALIDPDACVETLSGWFIPDRSHDVTDDQNEFYWSVISPEERAYLLEPRQYPSPCVWCGGRLRHASRCEEMHRDWTRLTFGKHRGKRIVDAPETYLKWLKGSSVTLDPEVRRAIEKRLGGAEQ